MTASPDAVRAALRQLPTGVVVVTAAPAAGAVGVTASSFTSVTLDPPTVLVCLRRDGRGAAGILAAGGYAVNVLAADQRRVAERFASDGMRQQHRFSGLGTRTEVTGAPVLDGTSAWLDCALALAQPFGTHLLMFGTVLASGQSENSPLVSHRGGLAGATAPRAS